MTATTTSRTAATPTPRGRIADVLLRSGAAAGLVFLVVSFAQVATRAGFDLRIHPLSALALGDLGWLQITNFLLTGALAIAFATGLRRATYPGPAGTWGPILIAGYGAGLIGAGVFVTDPGFGFPVGASAGLPDQFSTSAILHSVFAMVAFTALTAACIVFARRFAARGRRAWARYSVATGVVALALTALPLGTASASLRFAVGAVLTSAWLVALSRRMRADAS